MTRLTIEEAKVVQRERGLLEVHVVSIDERGFTIAHTDVERQRVRWDDSASLEQCRLHQWLVANGMPECGPGLYAVTTYEPDAVSESYRWDPYNFEPLEASP